MREILFRGKRVDNGEWVEGFVLVTSMSGVYIIGTKRRSRPSRTGVSLGDVVWQYEVNPASVGQFTGLTDAKSTKIFEGDIGIITLTGVCCIKATVQWVDGVFCWVADHFCVSIKEVACNMRNSNVKVIGNAHDNPELLKKGE